MNFTQEYIKMCERAEEIQQVTKTIDYYQNLTKKELVKHLMSIGVEFKKKKAG
jgi:hypothetical protein